MKLLRQIFYTLVIIVIAAYSPAKGAADTMNIDDLLRALDETPTKKASPTQQQKSPKAPSKALPPTPDRPPAPAPEWLSQKRAQGQADLSREVLRLTSDLNRLLDQNYLAQKQRERSEIEAKRLRFQEQVAIAQKGGPLGDLLIPIKQPTQHSSLDRFLEGRSPETYTTVKTKVTTQTPPRLTQQQQREAEQRRDSLFRMFNLDEERRAKAPTPTSQPQKASFFERLFGIGRSAKKQAEQEREARTRLTPVGAKAAEEMLRKQLEREQQEARTRLTPAGAKAAEEMLRKQLEREQQLPTKTASEVPLPPPLKTPKEPARLMDLSPKAPQAPSPKEFVATLPTTPSPTTRTFDADAPQQKKSALDRFKQIFSHQTHTSNGKQPQTPAQPQHHMPQLYSPPTKTTGQKLPTRKR